MIAPKHAVPMPPKEKSPQLIVRLPAPMVSAAAAVIRFLFSEKSTWFSTQMRPPVAAIRPKRTIARPPSTGVGMVWMRAPNLGQKPMARATNAAITKTRLE